MSERSIHLIDRDELLRNIEADIDISVTGVRNMEAVKCCLQNILDDVKESPVVDALPVIRCRDCKFRMATKNRHKNKERIYCRLFFDPIEHHYYRCHDDDFCSRGERSRT